MTGAKTLQSCPTATPGTVAHQAPLSTGVSRQEHWGGLPFPPLYSSRSQSPYLYLASENRGHFFSNTHTKAKRSHAALKIPCATVEIKIPQVAAKTAPSQERERAGGRGARGASPRLILEAPLLPIPGLAHSLTHFHSLALLFTRSLTRSRGRSSQSLSIGARTHSLSLLWIQVGCRRSLGTCPPIHLFPLSTPLNCPVGAQHQVWDKGCIST